MNTSTKSALSIARIIMIKNRLSYVDLGKRLLCAAFFLGAFVHPTSFISAKLYLKSLYQPYFSHTFYCDALFDANGYVKECPKGWSEEDCRLEWDHVVPASLLAKNLPCSQPQACPFHPEWTKRECCQESSIEFSFREANIQNIVPSLRKVNREKSNFLPGVVLNHPRVKVLCGMKFDPKKRIFEPVDAKKGWIARIYLSMDKAYHLPLTASQRQLLHHWDTQYPASIEEKRHYILLNLPK